MAHAMHSTKATHSGGFRFGNKGNPVTERTKSVYRTFHFPATTTLAQQKLSLRDKFCRGLKIRVIEKMTGQSGAQVSRLIASYAAWCGRRSTACTDSRRASHTTGCMRAVCGYLFAIDFPRHSAVLLHPFAEDGRKDTDNNVHLFGS